MSLWRRLWSTPKVTPNAKPNDAAASPPTRLLAVPLRLDGWTEGPPNGNLREWRDSHGDILTLAAPAEPLDLPLEERALQQYCRNLAARRNGGLIEVQAGSGSLSGTVSLIYKRLQPPAYVFTGMLVIPSREGFFVWTIVSGEHGMTGVREAVVTAELMAAGRLTVEDYKKSWAQDPYYPTYRFVDRSVLRFMSDDEGYDERFPHHPLSKVRRVLRALPTSLEVEPDMKIR